ncbi:MAG TPA: threonine synthase, partial [Bacteroidales bacterium]|nr:threonine synthase [Bacteroidales bacterium]
MNTGKFVFKCTDCGQEFSSNKVEYLCPACSRDKSTITPPRGVLKVVYDYQKIWETRKDFYEIKSNGFLDLLPVEDVSNMPPLKVGDTPLYLIKKIDDNLLPFALYLKDDSQNPTYSFKDRASALVSAYAKENSINTIVAASTGNAGSSLAGICASQHQKAIIMVPEKAPLAKLTQIIMYGASIVPVRGTYDEAFDLSIKATEEFGWYNRNTAFNPFTIEGKKTVSYEIAEQLKFSVPDRIFVPVGDGVIISGVYKGFEDLHMLDLIDRMPVIVAVQAEKSDNLVRNIGKDKFEIRPSTTIADSISVDIPRNFYMAQKYIRQYGGETITVTDDEITRASASLSKNTGLFAEPAAATAFAGMMEYNRQGRIEKGS